MRAGLRSAEIRFDFRLNAASPRNETGGVLSKGQTACAQFKPLTMMQRMQDIERAELKVFSNMFNQPIKAEAAR